MFAPNLVVFTDINAESGLSLHYLEPAAGYTVAGGFNPRSRITKKPQSPNRVKYFFANRAALSGLDCKWGFDSGGSAFAKAMAGQVHHRLLSNSPSGLVSASR
jgi:hypothetical protein